MSWIEEVHKFLFSLNLAEVDLEAGFDLKKQNIPKRLYKYRSFDQNGRSLDNLENDKVWLADPKTFNDPYDCNHYIDYKRLFDVHIENLPEDVKKSLTPLIHNILLKRSESVIFDFHKAGDKVKDGIKLCSFSERVSSTLMWAHYAHNHQGFCIEYDVTQPEVHELTSRFMFPVSYSDKVFDGTEIMESDMSKHFNNLYLNLAALHKALDWSYEKEWRLVFANGMMQKSRAWDMPKPTAVFCGSHILEANEAKVKEICQRRDIPIFKMVHDRHMYRMNPMNL